MKLKDVNTSYKSEKLFYSYLWGGLIGMYKIGTLGVVKEIPSKRWMGIF